MPAKSCLGAVIDALEMIYHVDVNAEGASETLNQDGMATLSI